MSSIQLPTVPTTTTIPGPVRTRVQARELWGNSWITLAYCEPLEVVQAASPGMTSARLRYRYGSIKREDASAYANYYPFVQVGWFVRVQVLGTTNSGLPGSNPQASTSTLFVGRVEKVDFDVHAADASTGVIAGDHLIHCLGMESLLDSRIVQGARIKRVDDGTYQDVERDLVFNSSDGTPGIEPGFRGIGNRSTDLETGKLHHVFADSGGEGATWTHEDIAWYLLTSGTGGDEPFQATFGGSNPIRFALAGQASELLSPIALPRVDLNGLTVRQALDRLIDRRRGMGWTISIYEDPDDADNEIIGVFVFSTTDEDVSGPGGAVHPANQWQVNIDLDDQSVVGMPRVSVRTQLYDWIVVRGERIVSMFSLSFADGTLDKGWTAGEESDYNGSDDTARRDESVDHVYRRYVIQSDWGAMVGNGEGSGSLTIAPELFNDGVVSIDQAGTRDWGLRLRRQLPVVGPDGVEYQPPFAIVKDADGNWIRADVEPVGADVRPLDNAMGVEVRATPNHLLALNHFGGATSSSVQPAYDWEDMIVTVAADCDNYARVQERMPGSYSIADAPEGRILTVDIPDAHLWYRVPSTVTSADDGVLTRSGGTTDDIILRDDTERLRRVMAMAKAWYARTRSTVRFEMDGIISAFGGPGTLIIAATSGTQFAPIGTVVTEQTFAFDPQPRTRIRTDYQELDFSRIT